MTDEQIDAIAARWAAATPGSWRYGGMSADERAYVEWDGAGNRYTVASVSLPVGSASATARAIAAAPADVAALLAEVDRMNREYERIVGELEQAVRETRRLRALMREDI